MLPALHRRNSLPSGYCSVYRREKLYFNSVILREDMSYTFNPTTSACLFTVDVAFGTKIHTIQVFNWVVYSYLQQDQQEQLAPGSYANLNFCTPQNLSSKGNFVAIPKIHGPVLTAFIQWIHKNRLAKCTAPRAVVEARQSEDAAYELKKLVEAQGGGGQVPDSAYLFCVKAFSNLEVNEVCKLINKNDDTDN